MSVVLRVLYLLPSRTGQSDLITLPSLVLPLPLSKPLSSTGVGDYDMCQEWMVYFLGYPEKVKHMNFYDSYVEYQKT